MFRKYKRKIKKIFCILKSVTVLLTSVVAPQRRAGLYVPDAHVPGSVVRHGANVYYNKRLPIAVSVGWCTDGAPTMTFFFFFFFFFFFLLFFLLNNTKTHKNIKPKKKIKKKKSIVQLISHLCIGHSNQQCAAQREKRHR
jgi:hypothetical protein